MRLNVALVTLAMVAVTFAQDPTCELNMEEKKCDAEEVFPNCQATSLEWTTCTCPPTTKCNLEENDGTCRYSCEPVAFENEDNNAGMGPGNGMA
uniref:Developmentally-regulated vdg1 n=1 Tax=Haliotis asinina TaxID=109174 RepID=Q5D217_HALAI|nr:developmentally-regulated vdg1 [Haliotis asinina]